MAAQYTIIHYERNGKDLFQDWLDCMRNLQGRTTIARRIKRMEKGNFGNHHFCRNGIWELVIDTGPGFRVYYSIIDNSIVILLCAGDKSSQQKDINNAIEYLKDFTERN